MNQYPVPMVKENLRLATMKQSQRERSRFAPSGRLITDDEIDLGQVWCDSERNVFLMRLFINVLKACCSFRFIRKSVSCLQFALGHSFRTLDNWGLSREWQRNDSQRKDEVSCIFKLWGTECLMF